MALEQEGWQHELVHWRIVGTLLSLCSAGNSHFEEVIVSTLGILDFLFSPQNAELGAYNRSAY